MSGRFVRAWAVACATSVFSGCSQPDIYCEATEAAAQAFLAYPAAGLSGSMVLEPGPRTTRTFLSVEVTGLPELWSLPGTLSSANLSVSYETRYEPTEPSNAVLPRLQLDVKPAVSQPQSRSYTETYRGTFELEPFRICTDRSAGPGCCAVGEETCSTEIVLSAQRFDTLYPRIIVEWDANVSAVVSSCVDSEREPTMTLTEVRR
jgi:hypothetical protein